MSLGIPFLQKTEGAGENVPGIGMGKFRGGQQQDVQAAVKEAISLARLSRVGGFG